MIDVDESGTDARVRRRTWMLGGGLLVASALLSLAMRNFIFLPGAFSLISPPDVLFAAGTVVLSVGLGAAGSITARRPLGTWALVGLAAWLLVASPLLQLVVPSDADGAELGEWVALSAMASVTVEVVALGLALIGVMRIGREEVVPLPWRWAPLWALLAVIGVRALRSGLLFGQNGLGSEALLALDGVGVLIEASAIGFLGVLALVLAARPLPGSTTVYRSGE